MKQICLGYKRKCSSVYCSAHPKRHTSSGRCSSDDDDDNNSLTTSMPTSSLTQSHKECHSTRHIIKKEINDTDSELTYVERARSENSVCLNKDDQPVTLASVDSEDEDELRDLLLSAGLAKWASFNVSVLKKLDSVISNQNAQMITLKKIADATRGMEEDDLVEDIIPAPIDSVEELNRFNSKLGDPKFNKKLIYVLSAIGGSNCQDTVHRIMKALGTNNLWGQYSLKGMKGKLPLQDLPVCKVVIKGAISGMLKYAPRRQGGYKFQQQLKTEVSALSIGVPFESSSEEDRIKPLSMIDCFKRSPGSED
ncbi:hypothetical protein LSH36_455g07085 [Paralvinella palmiformis]|uniref:DUF4806 domain-containing protein n=1 Tax=Paralvinella palmiformis TaxID=53620 RepID=A0AAD9JAR7_9ANNE|nr:hypothetical protein LSH36_455g07085 [Paralvinella palmiformis]